MENKILAQFAPMIGIVVIYMLAYKPLKKLCLHLLIKRKKLTLTAIFFLTVPFFLIGFFAIKGAQAQIEKEKDALYSKITISPSEQAVDELIANIEKYGCVNDPNSWNKLRSVWITINESPNVSTEKKKQLKQYLMLQGLTMHYQDAKIIDNCKL